MKRILVFLTALFLLSGCVYTTQTIEEGKYYYDRDDVVAYLKTYGELPENYITKKEARDMGWSVRNPGDYVIGGDEFGNREGLLPKGKYREADLREGYGENRGALRLVYSKDHIYYTEDHYESFEEMK